MVKYKIYVKNNYFYLEKINPVEIFSSLSKNIEINPNNIGKTSYRIYNLRDWNSATIITLSQLFKEDGSPYTQNEWETFYTENTGKSSASGGIITETDPVFSASEASSFQPGDKYFLDSVSSTTLLELSGEIEINTDNTKFNFPSGSGVIVDNSTFPPTKSVVYWANFTAETTPFLLTSTNTFLAIDVNGNLVKTQDLQAVHNTSDYIIVGWVEHTNGTIERTGTEPYYNLNLGQQFQQFLETLGAFNVDGNEVSANGANLKLNISAGTVVDNGLGFSQNIKAPNHYSSNAINQVQFRYFYRDGAGDWVNNLPLVSDVNVHNYDDGSGTLQTVPSGKWLLQRVFYYAPFGYLDIYHSQDYYNSAEEALDAYNRGGFEDNDYISYDIPVAIIVVKHSATDLTNTSDCIIRKISSSKLGGSSVSSGEVNTASNIGVNGVGLFKQKVGVDLEFKKINAGSNKITITDDTVNNEVDINVNEANFTNIPQSAVTNLTSALASKLSSVNLSTTQSSTNVIINSDAGTDATIPLADGINAGVSFNNYTAAEKNKLANINTVIQLNSGYTTTSTARGNIPELTFNMVAGSIYEIKLFLNYQTVAATTGISIGFTTPTGTASIVGSLMFTLTQAISNTELHQAIYNISSSNTLAGSFGTSTGVGAINAPHTGLFTGLLKCSADGTFQVQFGTEVAGSTAQLNQITTMIVTKLN